MSSPSLVAPAGVREITIAQAVNEALTEELRRDETVFVIGEDVAEAGTPFKVLSGLVEEFGPERILDSPISEAGITGLGVGAAMTGLRPVVGVTPRREPVLENLMPIHSLERDKSQPTDDRHPQEKNEPALVA